VGNVTQMGESAEKIRKMPKFGHKGLDMNRIHSMHLPSTNPSWTSKIFRFQKKMKYRSILCTKFVIKRKLQMTSKRLLLFSHDSRRLYFRVNSMKLCTLIECYLVTTFREFQLNCDNNNLIINFFVVIGLLDSTGGHTEMTFTKWF